MKTLTVLLSVIFVTLQSQAQITHTKTLYPIADGASEAEFGAEVDLEGDIMAVYNEGPKTVDILYRNQGGVDNWGLVQSIDEGGGNQFDDYLVGNVSISGNILAVGAFRDATIANQTGKVYLYSKDQGGIDNWGQIAVLSPESNSGANSGFGISMDIQVNRIAVGANGADGPTTRTGAVYVFEKDEGGIDNWGMVTKITTSDAVSDDNFGYSVALDGEYIVSGASGKDDNGNSSGAAYVFKKDEGGINNWGQLTKLVPSSITASDAFGFQLDLENDILAVSAYNSDLSQSNGGAIFIFHKNDGGPDNFGEITSLFPTDLTGFDRVGQRDVDVSGSRVFVSSTNRIDGIDRGAVYVFDRNSGGANNYGQIKKITASDGADRDLFSWSIAIDQQTVAVGAINHSHNEFWAGATYIYYENSGGVANWGEIIELLPTIDTSYGDRFGLDVAIQGNIAVVGAAEDDDDARSSGQVYIYYKDLGGTDNWGLHKELNPGSLEELDLFGYKVDIDNDVIAVSATGDDDAGVEFGAVYLFGKDVGGPDNWGLIKKLTVPTSRNLGTYIDLSGDELIASSFENTSRKGEAYIFERNEGGTDNWGLQVRIQPAEIANNEFFITVTIDNGTAAVGAYRRSELGSSAGMVYVFDKNLGGPANWGQVKKFAGSVTSGGENFGLSISLDNDVLAVGSASRRAYLFRKDLGGIDNWGEETMIDGTGIASTFARTIFTKDEFLFVGAFTSIDNKVFIYQQDIGGANNWGFLEEVLPPGAENELGFGIGMSYDVNRLLVGAHVALPGGQAHIYDNIIILPLEYLSFEVELNTAKEVYCLWMINSQDADKEFEVQRSKDAITFETIGAVENNSNQISFEFTDLSPLDNLSYYRIKYTSGSGDISYSDIRRIQILDDKELVIYPNPTEEFIHIQGDFAIGSSLKIYDGKGKLVISEVVAEDKLIHLDVSMLSSGIYRIQLSNKTFSFIKQ